MPLFFFMGFDKLLYFKRPCCFLIVCCFMKLNGKDNASIRCVNGNDPFCAKCVRHVSCLTCPFMICL
uniref:Uncharacterized protein n=1 Tax=Rhizophora mucronata TaxID=61149 RepID=A0A2P2LQG8_RHIMU